VGKRGRSITPAQVAHERAVERAWQETNRMRVAEEGRRNELAIMRYETITGPGSWDKNDMTSLLFEVGGGSLLDGMTDAEIVSWVESIARFDLDLNQEIARERAEIEEP
jgi:hypothetical protein